MKLDSLLHANQSYINPFKMMDHMPSQRQYRRYGKKNNAPPPMGFKSQILMIFVVLVFITIFVLVVSLFATKHVKHRGGAGRYRRRSQTYYNRHLYRMHKRSPDEVSEEDEINVVPLDTDSAIDVNLDVVDVRDVSDLTDKPPGSPVKDFICSKERDSPRSHYVILFTYIPTTISAKDLKYAINTVKMWSILDKNIQIVIYVPMNLNTTMTQKILEESCKNDIDVEVVDKLVMKSHATMRTLFELSYRIYEQATWYGYAEYGTLFDSSLYPALRMLASCHNITRKGNLVLGQSHSMELRDWDPTITSELDIDTVLEHINTFTVIDEEFLGNGIHYYFTRRYGFPWEKIPAVIPGGDNLDAFLMWYTMKNTSIAGVDATDAIFTLHQGELNITDPATSSKSVRLYNEAVITKAKYPLYYKKGLGVIGCIEYFLANENSPYYLLSKRSRKYIRRVVKGKPVTLSYYCKIHKTENIQLVETNGVIINKKIEEMH